MSWVTTWFKNLKEAISKTKNIDMILDAAGMAVSAASAMQDATPEARRAEAVKLMVNLLALKGVEAKASTVNWAIETALQVAKALKKQIEEAVK